MLQQSNELFNTTKRTFHNDGYGRVWLRPRTDRPGIYRIRYTFGSVGRP